MKTFRFFEMALIAVLVCANFASCNKDDDRANENSEKKLVKIVDNYQSCSFIYGNNGKLIKAIQETTSGTCLTYEYTWRNGTIRQDRSGGGGYTPISTIYHLENGFIKYSRCEEDPCEYYSYRQNRLNKLEYRDGSCWHIVKTTDWFENKLLYLVSYSKYYDNENNSNIEFTYNYNESCKKGYFPFIPEILGFDTYPPSGFTHSGGVLLMAHPEIAGIRTNELLAGYMYNDYKDCTYEYEFDEEGYISKIKKVNYAGSSSTTTYTLIWE